MAQKKYHSDYQPLNYLIEHVDLTIELDEHKTKVLNEMHVVRTEHGHKDSVFRLDAKDLEFVSVAVDGIELKSKEYELSDDHLTIHKLPADCVVTIRNNIDPTANTSCAGIYLSEGNYASQCESEDFRRITYFQDRPDNLATYRTTVIGDKAKNPLLLSNGNIIEEKILTDGRHMRVFDDPNPKPSYLFALVAGDFSSIKNYYLTQAGEKVELNIHVKDHKVEKTPHAMHCLKAAFAWDEKTYKLPYDLDVYNIVGVPDFNAGAMENKGLNIFNDDALLVSPATATDRDYEWIYTVVGHEFFHNYAGNRVTIEQWPELALKEGLATQKEREFLADMIGYTEPRIKNVNVLRSVQFPEDSGPTAHPVCVHEYEDIGNCYTTTTYYKGAELLSMLSGLLGQEVWREGVKEYFVRCDGTAANIEQFLNVLSDVSGRDLTQFSRWYHQAGTPQLDFSEHYDPKKQTYSLTVKQSCKPSAGQEEKRPFHIPIKMGLLDTSGKDLSLRLQGERRAKGTTRLLELTEAEQTFTFVGVKRKPIPSLLRDFSAPVSVGKSVVNNDDLIFLMANDSNEFNRWEAAQQLHERIIFNCVADIHAQKGPSIDSKYLDAIKTVINDSSLQPGLKADILSLPPSSVLLNKMSVFDPKALDQAISFVLSQSAKAHSKDLEKAYQQSQLDCTDVYSPANAGKRKLKNLTLDRLMKLALKQPDSPYVNWARDQFLLTRNMTDNLGALEAVYGQDHAKMGANCHEAGQLMMAQFYKTWQHDPQVVDKWLALQASYDGVDTIDHMKRMLEHPAFHLDNPNNVRALMRSFIRGNPKHFHDASGKGYELVANFCLELDQINEKMSSDIAKAMVLTSNLDFGRQSKLNEQLQRMAKTKMSDSMSEIVTSALAGFEAPQPPVEVVQIQEPAANLSELLREAVDFAGDEDMGQLGTQFLVQFRQPTTGENEPQQVRRSSRLAKK